MVIYTLHYKQNFEILISFTIISIRNHLASIFISRTVVQILLQRDLIMLTTKATIAASRITGSDNMKTGISPEVRVTNSVFFMFEGAKILNFKLHHILFMTDDTAQRMHF